MGGTGAVGSTDNYMGATYMRLMDAYRRGDMAAALLEQRRSQIGVNVLFESKYGDGVNIGKAILAAKVRAMYCVVIVCGVFRLWRLIIVCKQYNVDGSADGMDVVHVDVERWTVGGAFRQESLV